MTIRDIREAIAGLPDDTPIMELVTYYHYPPDITVEVKGITRTASGQLFIKITVEDDPGPDFVDEDEDDDDDDDEDSPTPRS